MSKYLVTGASGFIGDVITRRLLAQSSDVVCLGRRRGPEGANFISCDLSVDAIPEGAFNGIQRAFHVAGVAHSNAEALGRDTYVRTNVIATRKLLEQAVKHGCEKFIYLSSVQAVDNQGAGPWCEEDGQRAAGVYGQSKYDAEQLVHSYSDRIETCILRPTLVYGPNVKGNLRQMLQQIHMRRFPPIPEFGGLRSMVSVDDVAAAAILAMESDRAAGKTYILADGHDYTARKLYESITKAFGRSIPDWTLPAWSYRAGAKLCDQLQRLFAKSLPFNSTVLNKLAGSAQYSAARIQADLGWTPRYSLYDQVDAIVAAYLEETRA